MTATTLLSTSTMHDLTRRVFKHLRAQGIDCEHQPLNEEMFPDGEVWTQAPESVRNHDVYFFHSLRWPDPNTAIVQYTMTIDMLKRASVGSVHAVLPYASYMRQDRKDKGRVPISAKRMAELIEHDGAVRHTIAFDFHADQEQGFFDYAVDHLRGDLLLARHFKALPDLGPVIVVAPDVGASKRAQRFATRLDNAPLAIIDKRRLGPGETKVVHFIGPDRLDGMTAIMFDDMCDSGGTLKEGANVLYERGTQKVYAAVTHGLYTRGAEARLAEAGVDVVSLETIPRDAHYRAAHPHMTVLPVDVFLAEVLHESIDPRGSVSKLFTQE